MELNLDCAAAITPVTFQQKLYTNKYQCLIPFFFLDFINDLTGKNDLVDLKMIQRNVDIPWPT